MTDEQLEKLGEKLAATLHLMVMSGKIMTSHGNKTHKAVAEMVIDMVKEAEKE